MDRIEWSELDEHCEYDGAYEEGSGGDDDHYRWWGWECHQIPVQLKAAGQYVLKVTAWADQSGDVVTAFKFGANLYQEGDTWYRDMRPPGFDGGVVPDAETSLRWLARRIVEDNRFAEAAVMFWWPAVMGRDVLEVPEEEGDADFEALLLSASAQASEVVRLARGFRRGFRRGAAGDLKDLLVEIVLSRWFRVTSFDDTDPVRERALMAAGAKRLLTSEELARKTLAVTGFQWGRLHEGSRHWEPVHEQRVNALTGRADYRLLYGGIDSDGVTERARDLSSVMAGVAQSHALEASCPIVMKDFYLQSNESRRLFAGLDKTVSPISEFGRTFEVTAESWRDKETLSLRGSLRAGNGVVTLSFLNDYYDEVHGDRNVRLDRLDVRDSVGDVVVTHELERLDRLSDCNHPVGDHFALHCTGSLEVRVDIPSAGTYDIEVVVWADQGGDELPRLEIAVGSDPERSAGSRVIKAKLVELYATLLGVQVSEDSAEIRATYDLFVDVWSRKRAAGYGEFENWEAGIDCAWGSDQYYLEGIVEDAFVYREDWGDEHGARFDWDWDRINAHFETIDWSDRHGVARTWVVVLAYLMMDYRYLYL